LQKKRRLRFLSRFTAILYYEFLWNLRKKKTIGLFTLIFAIVTLFVFLPPALAYYDGQTLQSDPAFAYTTTSELNGIFLFLVAVATTMNTISGEFEAGSIVPLLTKPVSKTTVFLGKLTAAFVTLLGLFAFLGVYTTIGGVLTRGPQDSLQVVPIGVLGLTMATTVWAAIVLFLGTLSKNSIVAALGSFGIYIGVTIVGGLVSVFLGQTSVLLYAPGAGATATSISCTGPVGNNVESLGSGTDWLGRLLVEWIIHPNNCLNYIGFRFRGGNPNPETFLLSSDPISTAALRTLGISLAYIVGLLGISWFAFRRSQILE
jgi:ABC-type transport system involved in multi-copper enzyme maturation permease subunit